MKILNDLLGDFPLETFLEKHFTRLPYSAPQGAKNFLNLLTWERVEEVIKKGDSILRIVQDGRMIKDHSKESFEEAKKHHQNGSTLLLRYAEKSSPDLKEVAQDFAGLFHTEVDIQLYCTPEGHNAFGQHYDVEEVFIIQTKGSKRYTIRPNTIHPNPLVSSIPEDLGHEKETSELKITVTLTPGDWLYIPSGWWHVAQTLEESMHVSIGLMPSSAVDAIHYLPRYLARLPFWRTRMPIHQEFPTPRDEVIFYQDAFRTLGKDLEKHLSSPEFIREFLDFKRKR